MSKPNRGMRRRERDMEAGMVFAWRVPGGSLGRMAIGILVASGLFAGAASMVRVKGPVQRKESREAARIVVLRANDPASRELLDWARFNSPFPDRWEPAQEGLLAARMAEVTGDLERQSAYEARLRPRLVLPEESTLPGLIGDDPRAFTAPAPTDAVGRAVAVDLPVRAISVAANGLGPRWGRRSMAWVGDHGAELMGCEARFMVGVTPDGAVGMCMLVDKSKALSKDAGAELDAALERWLRGQKLDPDAEADGLSWGVVRIRLEPTVELEERDD